jgi:UPF0716 family protein affecting phage T7 exclusion
LLKIQRVDFAVLIRLFLLFVLLPLADLILLLAIAQIFNFWTSVALIIVSALIGALLVKRSGRNVMRRIREKLAARQLPTDSLADGAIVLFAGGLLLAPGLITDTIGLSMLIPYTRTWYKRRLIRWVKSYFQIQTFSTSTEFYDEAQVVDSHVVKNDLDTGNSKEGDDDSPKVVYPDRIESGPFD